MSTQPFSGMAKVESHRAYSAALACICHIERERNRIFREESEEVLANPPIMKWWYDHYEWKLSQPFMSYKAVLTIEHAYEWVRKIPRWNHPLWSTYWERERNASLDIINMVKLNDDIYVSPIQGKIIRWFKEGEFNERNNSNS